MAIIYRPRVIHDPGDLISETFKSGDRYIFEQYFGGDLNGSEGAIALYESNDHSIRTIWDFSIIGNIFAFYCNFIGIEVINGTIYCDESCIDGGNNVGIHFYVPPVANNLISSGLGITPIGMLPVQIQKRGYLTFRQ